MHDLLPGNRAGHDPTTRQVIEWGEVSLTQVNAAQRVKRMLMAGISRNSP